MRHGQPVRWRVVALVLVLAGTWACGDSDGTPSGISPETAPVTVTFLEHGNPTYGVANGVAFMEYMKAHPNVKIEVTTIQYSSLTPTLLADLKADKLGYDFLQVPPSWVCSFAENLVDVPADVLSLNDAQNTFLPAPLAGSVCDGRLKGLPIEYNLEYGGVVVNLDKYEAKFPGRTPSWDNWQSFIAEAAALAEYDVNGTPMANGLDLDPGFPQVAKHIFLSQILQRGGSYWTANGDFDFSTPAARDSLAEIASWVTRDKVMHMSLIPGTGQDSWVVPRLAAGATGYGWNDPNKPLSVMGYVGTWGLALTRQLRPMGNATRYDFFTLPPMVGTQHKFVQNSGWAFAVPRTSRNQKVAWDIARTLALSPAAMRTWATTTGALPALRQNATAAAAATDPILAKVQGLLELGQWVGYIPAAAIETVEGAINSNLFDVIRGTKSVDQALADMQRASNEALARNR